MVKHILGREEALIDDMCEKEVTSFRLCRLSACPGHRPSLPLPPDALAFLSGFFTSFSSTPTTTPSRARASASASVYLSCMSHCSLCRSQTHTHTKGGCRGQEGAAKVVDGRDVCGQWLGERCIHIVRTQQRPGLERCECLWALCCCPITRWQHGGQESQICRHCCQECC